MKSNSFRGIKGRFASNRRLLTVILTVFWTVMVWLSCVDAHAQTPQVAWIRQSGPVGPNSSLVGRSPIDSAGNLYSVTIYNSSTFSFGGFTVTNLSTPTSGFSLENDVFVSKYDSAGNVLWLRGIGGNSWDEAWGCAPDMAGNVYVTGGTFSTNMVLGNTAFASRGRWDCFLVKYDAQGNILWSRQAGGSDDESESRVATDRDGNALVVCNFSSTNLIVGTNLLSCPDGSSLFLAKYSATGDVAWVRQINTHTRSICSVQLDGAGNIYVSGDFYPTAEFGNATLSTSATGVFIAKYDSAGNLLWARQAASGSSLVSTDMAVDLQGNSYLTGIFSADAVIGTNAFSHVGEEDTFVVKLDSGGNFVWARAITGTRMEMPCAVGVDGFGNCYVTGNSYSAIINFGGVAVTNNGPLFPKSEFYPFIVKYESGGQLLWYKTLPSPHVENILSIGGVDFWGNVYLGGKVEALTNVFQMDGFSLGCSVDMTYYFSKINGPQLSAAATNNQLLISWPTNAVGLHLESANIMSGPWLAVTNTPVLSGEQNTVTFGTSSDSQFFRLNGP
ncbi:MAG: hypothetical protein JWQ71_3682 [Pedosphaera sp.]|nr:hypothetical protein [Pedosphaera sp.]